MSTVQHDPGPRRRGRVAKGPVVRTGPVGEFAYRLFELKKAAGDPSYDRMRSEFGALASKSALSAAARGHRLPSWETTWEFVRSLEVGVLGADAESVRKRWHEHWKAAAALSNDGTEPVDGPDPAKAEVLQPVAERPPQVPRWVAFVLVGLIAATTLLLVSVVEFW